MMNQFGISAEFDQARVDAIRDRIDDENYNFDPDEVAGKIIDIEIALSGELC